MKIKTASTVFVFDLDDTLYLERDYWHSGMKQISILLESLFGGKSEQHLENILKSEESVAFDDICRDFKMPSSFKDTLIWHYRLHRPTITLTETVRNLLNYLQTNSAGVFILTDGRLITQRMKLIALGISSIKSYISEEFCETKPGLIRYKAIEESHPGNNFLYVADNLDKDFIAPNQLGWTTVGLKAKESNIYRQYPDKYKRESLPDLWIENLEDLAQFCT